MNIAICPSCKNADIEKFDNKNMFWCHSCGEEWHNSELEIITIDEYFKVDDNTKSIDWSSKKVK
ncbi:hypothetical protein [Clostridium perfringens]|uniref:hypothetical protein n=1 Tax=Clostridium perfringens TaxID=1502 RepID=UPI0030CE98E4